MTDGAVGPQSRARAVITYFAYRGSATCLRLLPRPFARRLARAAALVAWVAGPNRRRIVAANLAPVLDAPLASRAVRHLVRRAYLNYGDYWADAGRLRTADPKRHPERFELRGGESFWKAVEAGKGMILVLPHVGCWEAGAAWTASVGQPLATVAEVLEPPELFSWFVEQRKRVGLKVLPIAPHTASQLLSVLEQGRAIALLADRDVIGDGVRVQFFGHSTTVPGGPALLALRSGAALLPAAVYFTRGGYVLEVGGAIDTVRTRSLREDVARVSQAMVNALEPLIRAAPEQWHVFQPLWPEPNAVAPT